MSGKHVDALVVEKLTTVGWSAGQIAKELGCSQRTVHRIRVRRSIAKPPRRLMTAEEIALAERLLDDGCSLAEVERTLGRSQGALYRRFKDRTWTRQQAGELGGWSSAAARAERKRMNHEA